MNTTITLIYMTGAILLLDVARAQDSAKFGRELVD
jgi:hypothetical protein